MKDPVISAKEIKEEFFEIDVTTADHLTQKLEESRKKNSLHTDFDENKFKNNLLTAKILIDNKGKIELADEDKIRTLGKTINKYVKPNQIAITKDLKINIFNRVEGDELGKDIQLEFAEDNSALYDVPNVKEFAGSTIYTINGKTVSGWSLYYSPNCIRSPEDYSKNVDCTYNVPYIWAAYEVKSQLGLGANFKIVDNEEGLSECERYAEWYLKKHLKLDTNTRKKIAVHKYLYGNAYVHLKRNPKTGVVTKLTILQPERMKIYLDRLTQKVLFYTYMPPIIGAMALVPYYSGANYDVGKANMQSLMYSPALRFPSPVIIPVNDVLHFKINDYTEYPFGFSELKAAVDVAQARYDVNLLSPYYFKKYCKSMIWASYSGEDINAGKIKEKMDNMKNMLQSLEPGSDIITGPGWGVSTINPAIGQSEIFNLTNDLDTQIFSVLGVPESYFKARGSTDRMISESDKIFMAKIKQEQLDFADTIFDRILKQALDARFGKEYFIQKTLAIQQVGQSPVPPEVRPETADGPAPGFNVLTYKDIKDDKKFTPDIEVMDEYDVMLAYPRMVFDELTKKDETQEISNTISLLNNGIIDVKRAAKRVGEQPPEIIEDEADGDNPKVDNANNNMLTRSSMDMNRTQKGDMDKPVNPEGKFKSSDNALQKEKDKDGNYRIAGETKYKKETAENTQVGVIIIGDKEIPITEE